MLDLDVELRGRVPAMRGVSWRVVVAFAASIVAGCHPPYQAPSLAEPHATVKVRVVYHDTPGTELEQAIHLNGHTLSVPPPVTLPGEISRAIPVRLESASIDVNTSFSHTITRMESRTEQYQCGVSTYKCGTSTCTRTNYCTHTVMKPVTVRATDAACERAVGLAPRQDAVYLLQYDYFASGRCTLACLHEWPQPDGSFRNTPCEAPPPS